MMHNDKNWPNNILSKAIFMRKITSCTTFERFENNGN